MHFFNSPAGEMTPDIKEFLKTVDTDDLTTEKQVLQIKEAVINHGFKALQEYTAKFDNFKLTESNLRVSAEEVRKLAAQIDPLINQALETAIDRVKTFHKLQLQTGFEYCDQDGNNMGQRILPLDSAAVYVPGGRALYPSTVYMSVIPALIAGVKRIIILSPPQTFINSPAVARLLELLNVNEVYRIGGAQAIFAAAYGTALIPPVDKIVGPGNQYVAKAKQLVYGKVAIDMIAGPSEIFIIVDSTDPQDISLIAADLLSQAEHDPQARVCVVGTNENFLKEIAKELLKQAYDLPQDLKNNALTSITDKGLAVFCKDNNACINLANQLAPEHLEIFSNDPYPILKQIRHAGSVFLGKYTPEAVGDYLGGPNHVLPTVGTARFSSPLGVYDFQKKTSFLAFNKPSLEKFKPLITTIARAEGLEAHARSVEARFKTSNE